MYHQHYAQTGYRLLCSTCRVNLQSSARALNLIADGFEFSHNLSVLSFCSMHFSWTLINVCNKIAHGDLVTLIQFWLELTVVCVLSNEHFQSAFAGTSNSVLFGG